jgi:hypothetical protein
MNENFAEDEVIGRLIREEGLLRTSPGFTDRVMQLVESSVQKKETSFKPLINGKTWVIIAMAVAFLLLVCIVISATGNTVQLSYISKIKTLTDVLMVYHFPQKLDPGITMLVTLILAIASLLLFLDVLLNNRLRGLIK